jgi:poly-gamma-glutamate capsule biosynthesis protein CapA/YwtB (metallophosphatase superfamily)
MRGVLGLVLMLACGESGSRDGERAQAIAPSPVDASPAPAPVSAPTPTRPSASPSSGAGAPDSEVRASPTEAEPRPELLDLVFVGDVVLGEYVFDGHRSFAGPLAPGDPFAAVAELLRADVVVGNLESPVMRQIPTKSPLRYGHRFGASAPAVAALAAGGFHVMSVANNHANDLGREGLEQTPEVLRAHGITPIGEARHDGAPLRVVTTEHRGWRIGWLAATTWLNHAPVPGDPKVPVVAVSRLERTLVPLVEQARAEHDLVIVLLHWGRERRERPEAAQVRAAHAFIDAGADLVIGHHPHVLQGIERHGEGLIAYSLGNFLFPAREEAFRDSAVLRVRVSGEPRGIAGATAHPVRLSPAPTHAPGLTTPGQRRLIEERLQRLGAARRTPWSRGAGMVTLARSRPVMAAGIGPGRQITTIPLASTAQNQ